MLVGRSVRWHGEKVWQENSMNHIGRTAREIAGAIQRKLGITFTANSRIHIYHKNRL